MMKEMSSDELERLLISWTGITCPNPKKNLYVVMLDKHEKPTFDKNNYKIKLPFYEDVKSMKDAIYSAIYLSGGYIQDKNIYREKYIKYKTKYYKLLNNYNI